jgi:predicted nucleic acid-binding protein
MIVFLDTNILGKLTNPNQLPEAVECQVWFERLLAKGVYLVSSELCFYELKRSLILAANQGGINRGIKKLDDLRLFVEFFPVDRAVAELSSMLWAEARTKNTPTAKADNIDIDIMIAAHWRLLTEEFPGREVVIATTNIKHLSLFAEAREWQNISF